MNVEIGTGFGMARDDSSLIKRIINKKGGETPWKRGDVTAATVPDGASRAKVPASSVIPDLARSATGRAAASAAALGSADFA